MKDKQKVWHLDDTSLNQGGELSSPLNYQWQSQRVEFTKLFCQEKNCPCTKQCVVQCHEQLKLQLLSLNWHSFAKFACCLTNTVRQKGFSFFFFKKAATACWWNFMQAFFVQKCFAKLFSSYVLALAKVQQHFRTKNACVKCWWNWPLELISPTFHKHFCTTLTCTAFLYLQYVFVYFWWEENWKKLLIKCWWNWHFEDRENEEIGETKKKRSVH